MVVLTTRRIHLIARPSHRVRRGEAATATPVSEPVRLCGLYLSVMDRMGAPTARFGDATPPLAGL